MTQRRRTARKLLIASIGVATVNYVAACDDKGGGYTSGNLVGPPSYDASPEGVDANFTSGNLVPPPPMDAGTDPVKDAGAGDTDAGTEDAG